jgi:hypothetical protein
MVRSFIKYSSDYSSMNGQAQDPHTPHHPPLASTIDRKYAHFVRGGRRRSRYSRGKGWLMWWWWGPCACPSVPAPINVVVGALCLPVRFPRRSMWWWWVRGSCPSASRADQCGGGGGLVLARRFPRRSMWVRGSCPSWLCSQPITFCNGLMQYSENNSPQILSSPSSLKVE